MNDIITEIVIGALFSASAFVAGMLLKDKVLAIFRANKPS